MSKQAPLIGRGAIVTACRILEAIRTNAELESLLIEYDFDELVGLGGSINNKLLSLQKFAAANPDHLISTDLGAKPLGTLIVEEAIRLVGWSSRSAPLWDKLERYLNLDGYSFLKQVESDWNGESVVIKGVSISMPDFVELPESASEVDILLAQNGFTIAERHLASAKENIAQADWEAANSQCRTFLEALTDAIANRLYHADASGLTSGLQMRQLLANKGFLSRDKHEFGDGNKQSFLPGLAKLLHPDGAHPGISTQHDAMFRLQLVVVTARWLMKRLEKELRG